MRIPLLSKSQVSELAKTLDEMVTDFRNRPLDTGWYVWADPLSMKVREGGRIVGIVCVVAVGVDSEGHCEILGAELATTQDGADWLAFFRSLVARGLSGTQLVISDAHLCLTDGMASVQPAVPWQRRRTHHMGNLLTNAPKQSEAMAAAVVPMIFRQPTPSDVESSTPRLRIISVRHPARF